jgi:hypothetical protein
MTLDYYHVDAFADRVFTGNPAGVVPLKRWLPATILQSLAMENNHSETAFFVPRGDAFHLRWFTPKVEIDLCGHATLAAAHVLWTHLAHSEDPIRFETMSGPVSVSRESGRLMLDFPARPPQTVEVSPPALAEALGAKPFQVWKTNNYLAVFRREEELRALSPDFDKLAALDCFGVIATARARVSISSPVSSHPGWHRRGSRHRQRALHAHTLLVKAPRQAAAPCRAALATWRPAVVRGRRRPREDRRPRRHLHEGTDRSLTRPEPTLGHRIMHAAPESAGHRCESAAFFRRTRGPRPTSQ